MTIITQEDDLINYDSIKRITSFVAEVQDEETNESTDLCVVIAFDNNSKVTDEDIASSSDLDVIDGVINLGVYNNHEECDSAISSLISALKSNESVFKMPQPRW